MSLRLLYLILFWVLNLLLLFGRSSASKDVKIRRHFGVHVGHQRSPPVSTYTNGTSGISAKIPQASL